MAIDFSLKENDVLLHSKWWLIALLRN